MKKLIVGLAVFLCISGVASAKDFYIVETNIYHQDTLVDSPKMGVEANKEASMSVGDSSGDGYHLSLLLKEMSEKVVDVSINLKLKNKEFYPELGVELGKEATVVVDETKLTITVNKSST